MNKKSIITALLALIAMKGLGQIANDYWVAADNYHIQIVRKCMLYIDWQPSIEVFRVGIFSIKWYSLLWMFGLMIAYMIVKHLYKQQGVPEEMFYPQFFYCFIGHS